MRTRLMPAKPATSTKPAYSRQVPAKPAVPVKPPYAKPRVVKPLNVPLKGRR
jgi:hypothetical protein